MWMLHRSADVLVIFSASCYFPAYDVTDPETPDTTKDHGCEQNRQSGDEGATFTDIRSTGGNESSSWFHWDNYFLSIIIMCQQLCWSHCLRLRAVRVECRLFLSCCFSGKFFWSVFNLLSWFGPKAADCVFVMRWQRRGRSCPLLLKKVDRCQKSVKVAYQCNIGWV